MMNHRAVNAAVRCYSSARVGGTQLGWNGKRVVDGMSTGGFKKISQERLMDHQAVRDGTGRVFKRFFQTTRVKYGGGAPSGPRPKEYGGFRPPKVSPFLTRAGEGMMTVTWFWIFYRAKHDLVYMLGIKHPWDDHH